MDPYACNELPDEMDEIDEIAEMTWRFKDGTLYLEGTGNVSCELATELAEEGILEQIQQVIIGDGCTGIGMGAFVGCTCLISLMIPTKVQALGWYSLMGCPALTEIHIDPKNPYLTVQDGVVFSKDEQELSFCATGKIGTYQIPHGVTKIGYHAFFGCKHLTEIIIPDSVTEISFGAFSDCDGLTTLNIPDSVTLIGYGAFLGVPHIHYTGPASDHRGDHWGAIHYNN